MVELNWTVTRRIIYTPDLYLFLELQLSLGEYQSGPLKSLTVIKIPPKYIVNPTKIPYNEYLVLYFCLGEAK